MNPTTRRLPPNVYPLQAFLDIERLMFKLNMTPADVMTLLADVMKDLDRQITEFEESGDGLPFPAL